MKLPIKRSFWGSGEPFVWLSGGALALCLIMVGAMLLLILVNGAGFFWPNDIASLVLKDGAKLIGEIVAHETVDGQVKLKLKRGNRDVTGTDFLWISESDVAAIDYPDNALVLERREWGNFYGTAQGVKADSAAVAVMQPVTIAEIVTSVQEASELLDEIREIERNQIGSINYNQEQIRLKLRKLEIAGEQDASAEQQQLLTEQESLALEYSQAEQRLSVLRERPRSMLIAQVDSGQTVELPFPSIVRAYQPNQMSTAAKLRLYGSKFWEFVWDDPRESNTEGGVFPAIFGTVMMVFIMSIVVTPLGVLAAVYLREYAKQGRFVSTVRIAVNNLAGVPSIVFGVFGVGFFIYIVGGSIDALFYPEVLPTPTFGTGGILWASLTLALLTVPTVIVATEEGLASIPKSLREGSYALGATKFETTWRVVLPALAPSILTGMILAVARAAGEVAPLMVTGVVKLAPALPLDSNWPFIHLDRKFMHLGFHIYDVGFQSPNVDAARPMVFTTTMLLLFIVVSLNLFALVMRNRLRRRFMVSAV